MGRQRGGGGVGGVRAGGAGWRGLVRHAHTDSNPGLAVSPPPPVCSRRCFPCCRVSLGLCRVLSADEDVANAVQAHPHLPVLATSGIENTVKVRAAI